MALCTDNSQTSGSFYLRTQLNICTTTCHVGSNSYCRALTCLSYNFSFFLVQFRIQHVMLNLTQGKHLTQHFRDFDRSSTNQYRTSGFYHLFNFFDYRFILFTFCFVYTIVHIDAGNRTVCRNNYYIQLINIPEFSGFCFCCTGHTRKLMIHTEVILQSNSCKSLSCSFNLNTFLSFYSLVQSVAPTTTVHDTSCLFVDNLNLSVHNDIISIFFEHCICFKQLIDCMNAF
ncbi:uncharacterized protein BN461_02208 [Bacteroides sp. CAG:1076]|nr:uncharacterized protein BN461_02208 [Bacteroides sp. CAG:1076]